jgi:hypothetical protein
MEKAYDTYHRRGENGASLILIVEADIPTRDGQRQSCGSLSEALYGRGESIVDFGVPRGAEVEAVSKAERHRTCTSDIAGGFGDEKSGALTRVCLYPVGIPIQAGR